MILGHARKGLDTVLNGRGRFTFYSPVLQNNGHMIHLNKQTGIPFQYMTEL